MAEILPIWCKTLFILIEEKKFVDFAKYSYYTFSIDNV